MIRAVAAATVPKLPVVIGGAHGTGADGMCSRAAEPRFLWLWPNAGVAATNPEQAAAATLAIERDRLKGQGVALSPADERTLRQSIADTCDRENSAYYSTARMWDDGILDPAETRRAIALGLSVALKVPMRSVTHPIAS